MAAPPQCSSSSPDFDFDFDFGFDFGFGFGFSPDELEVAQVLLQFPFLIQKSHFSLGLSPAWSFRRKRSVLDSPPSSSATPAADSASNKLKETSPTTPLSLNSLPPSRSESDDNNNANAKRSNNKPISLTLNNKKSKYLGTIDELTKQNQVLEGNVEAMKQHYNDLKAINSELKAKKIEMILGCSSKNESKIPEIGTTSSSAMKTVKFTVKSPSSAVENQQKNHNEIQPSIKNNQTAPIPEQSNNNNNNKSQKFQIPVGGVPLYDPSIGPMGIPDLNIPIEELNEIRNYNKLMAARARQNRIQICKSKNNGANRFQTPPNPCT